LKKNKGQAQGGQEKKKKNPARPVMEKKILKTMADIR